MGSRFNSRRLWVHQRTAKEVDDPDNDGDVTSRIRDRRKVVSNPSAREGRGTTIVIITEWRAEHETHQVNQVGWRPEEANFQAHTSRSGETVEYLVGLVGGQYVLV